jgi:hypothetical protein
MVEYDPNIDLRLQLIKKDDGSGLNMPFLFKKLDCTLSIQSGRYIRCEYQHDITKNITAYPLWNREINFNDLGHYSPYSYEIAILSNSDEFMNNFMKKDKFESLYGVENSMYIYGDDTEFIETGIYNYAETSRVIDIANKLYEMNL